jgi:hypothetical protein
VPAAADALVLVVIAVGDGPGAGAQFTVAVEREMEALAARGVTHTAADREVLVPLGAVVADEARRAELGVELLQ